ncbi:MAG: hypothetical protein UX36_C0006G0003 [Microgenomates group bacterium GW2011_GWC1_46_15]|nr:MAG: hypothetical protein UX36_C0006G0003 [Microgenomates group bacterium GW2011_GWC1_46_15]
MEHKPYSQQVAEMNREREGRMLETPDWDEDGHIAPEVGKQYSRFEQEHLVSTTMRLEPIFDSTKISFGHVMNRLRVTDDCEGHELREEARLLSIAYALKLKGIKPRKHSGVSERLEKFVNRVLRKQEIK